jgi:hypothetical protein
MHQSAASHTDNSRASNWQWVQVWVMTGMWSAFIATGFGILMNYSQQSGAPADPPDNWPITSRICRTPNTPNLVMFIHAKCSCTHASMSELMRVLTKARRPVSTHLVLMHCEQDESDGDQQSLWPRADLISAANIIIDSDGRLTTTFGVHTSGHILAYDIDGQLQFDGGITASRGHEGDSVGKTMILAAIAGTNKHKNVAPVYGCALHDNAEGLQQ